MIEPELTAPAAPGWRALYCEDETYLTTPVVAWVIGPHGISGGTLGATYEATALVRDDNGRMMLVDPDDDRFVSFLAPGEDAKTIAKGEHDCFWEAVET